MMQRKSSLLREENGMGAVEFALAAPLLFALIVGIAQLGTLYFANSGLKSAVAEGARLATLHPRPSHQQIITRITDSRFGLDPAFISNPTVTGASVNDRDYVEIEMSYAVPLDFIFYRTSPITLVERRRVFVYPT